VEWNRGTPILGVHVGARFDQRRDRERPERGRREVQRGVPDVQLMHVLDETLDGDARPRELGRRSDEAHRPGLVGDDRGEELVKRRRAV